MSLCPSPMICKRINGFIKYKYKLVHGFAPRVFLEIKYIKTSDFVIEDLGIMEEDVYDLEIENSHNFFANDILLHNSARS